MYANYYNLGTDVLVDGQNVEVSNRLTLIRRPGSTAGLTVNAVPILSSANVPDIPLSFYSFHEIGGVVRVFVDTAGAPYLLTSANVIPIFTKGSGAGQAYYQGVGQSLYFSDAVEQQKWLDFGAGNPGNSFALITKTELTSNIATITSINNFAVGQTVVISATTSTSGLFNGTFVITFANTAQFSFNLVHADVAVVSDTGFANGTWNWGIAAPTASPSLVITASGAAAAAWVASTVFSTMGFIVDANGNVQQMISVNASGTNTTQLGTTANGEPNWNQTPGGTTTDNTITWTNWGPIPEWAKQTLYENAGVGGNAVTASQIYDPASNSVQLNVSPGFSQATSGSIKPLFKAIQGSSLHDPNSVSPPAVKWWSVFPKPSRWLPNKSYPAFLGVDTAATCITEPYNLPAPSGQTVYLQISGGGTSGASGTAPKFATAIGDLTSDGDIIWLCLGSATWQATHTYTGWTGVQPVFSVIKDLNGNMQVCTLTGISSATQPYAQWIAGHAYSLTNKIVDQNGNIQRVTTAGTSGVSKTLSNTDITSGVATYQTTTNHGYAIGQLVTITGSTHNSAFNVTNGRIISLPAVDKFTLNILHDDIVSAADAGNAKAGPTWATTLSATTADGTGTLVWTNDGPGTAWGFNYGDTTTDGNVKWACVGSSMAWAASTQWFLPISGFAPPTASQPYGGAEVIGTAFVQAVIQSGKSDTTTQPTWSIVNGNFVLDPSNSNTQIVWRNIAAQSAQSLSWTKGFGYCYAFKARLANDIYVTEAPPGQDLILGPAIGSADGSVSTASPTIQMAVGVNAGSVVSVSGLGSTDPQVDTVSIFRTQDGGATYFWLTDINNPNDVGGLAQPWTFRDFLPDNPTNTFPGLNTLVLAPLAHSNDPPQVGFINGVQHFGRIFGSVGANVFCSQGPLVGGASQPPGNGYTAFNPAQFWTFPSPVTKLVPTTTALLVFTTSDLFMIAGGPNVNTLFPNILIPGLGLTSFNALCQQGGLLYMLTADNQGVSLDPNVGVSEVGFPIGDQLNGFSPANSYAAFHIQGSNDKALYIADGSTGWFRCNPHQAPDSGVSGPVWSPKANITGGCKAIASLEVSPGLHALLIGATSANHPITVRDSYYTVFTDNGTPYASNCTLGSLVLANPGQIAEIGFITAEFKKLGTSPKLLVLLDELSGTFEDLSGYKFLGTTGLPPQDPPSLYGATLTPNTIYANRYYFAQSVNGQAPQPVALRHMQIKFDFGAVDSVQNEILTFCIFGRHWKEN